MECDKLGVQEDIMVSIWCVTYNQKDYIRDALDGFLMQKTSFRYEIYVFDDASTDGTSDIVKEYAEKHPKVVFPLIMKENTFRGPNRHEIKKTLRRNLLKGKYIACCEGDDYWIDCNKLQQQVDYMESHRDCSMCLHNAYWFDCEKGIKVPANPFECDGTGRKVSPSEIISQKQGHPPTASFLYRREINYLDDLFFNGPIGDYPLQLAALTTGYIYYSNRIMSVYRWMSANSYNKTMKTDGDLFTYFSLGLTQFLINYNRYTEYMYQDDVLNRIWRLVYNLIVNQGKNNTIEELFNKCNYSLRIDASTVEKLEMIRCQMVDEDYCGDHILEFIAKHKYIVVMGIGKYACSITKQLEKNNIHFEGYVVSKKEVRENEFMGKSVWQLDEIPFEKEKVGVIVAILPMDKNDLDSSLNRVGLLEQSFNPFEWRGDYN